MMAKVEGMPLTALEEGIDWDWETFAEYLARFDGNLAVNAGFLVGHCALRRKVMGTAAVGSQPTDEQLRDMEELLAIAAAAGVARSLGFPFMLAARAQNFVGGKPDLEDTIKRLQAFEKAGADVLFAPGLPDIDSVRRVCQSVSKPVNFMVGIPGRSFTVAELTAAGVKRISLATSLYKAAVTGFMAAAKETLERGTFTYVESSVSTRDLAAYLD